MKIIKLLLDALLDVLAWVVFLVGAGGIAAIVCGVAYLLVRDIARVGIGPFLVAIWLFASLCAAILVFARAFKWALKRLE